MFHNVKNIKKLNKLHDPYARKIHEKTPGRSSDLSPARCLPVPCVSEQWQGNYRALFQDLQQRVLSGIFTRFPLSIKEFFFDEPNSLQSKIKITKRRGRKNAKKSTAVEN